MEAIRHRRGAEARRVIYDKTNSPLSTKRTVPAVPAVLCSTQECALDATVFVGPASDNPRQAESTAVGGIRMPHLAMENSRCHH